MRVITFSTKFPAKHPKKGQQTFFVEQILNEVCLKGKNGIVDINWLDKPIRDIVNDFFLLSGEIKKKHTIRAGNRWKVGDYFSPRVWSGKPYASKQIQFLPAIQIKKIFSFKIFFEPYHKATFFINGKEIVDGNLIEQIAINDGLQYLDFFDWFNIHPKGKEFKFDGQILCWDEKINY